jgi:hypothetical protein
MAVYSRRVIQQPNRVEYFLPVESNWTEVGKLLSALRNEVNSTFDDAVWTRATEEELIFWFNEKVTPVDFDPAYGAHFSIRVNPNHVLGDATISLHLQRADNKIQLRTQHTDDKKRWTTAILDKSDLDELILKLVKMRDDLEN